MTFLPFSEAVADGNPSSNSMSSLGAESFNFSMRTSNTWQRFVNKQTKVHLESFASILWGYSKSNAGRGILELRNRYSFVKHIIFSLLKGRPVVIYAQPSNERYIYIYIYSLNFLITYKYNYNSLVKKLIVALSLFVPGHWRKSPAVVPWSSKPIRMADLACLKLVGLSKQKPISSAVEVIYYKMKPPHHTHTHTPNNLYRNIYPNLILKMRHFMRQCMLLMLV